jgi:hypothetical protein
MTSLPPVGAAALGQLLAEALAADVVPTGPAAPVEDVTTSLAATPAPTALANAIQDAASIQDSLAPLFADLASAAASPRTPPDLRAAIAGVLDLARPIDPPPSAEILRQALQTSGLFLEAALAGGAAPADGDLKAALLTLAQALTASSQSPAPQRGNAARPAPPSLGGPLRGQAAADPSLPPDAPGELIAGRLLAQTDAALARHTLSQAASAAPAPDKPGAAQWLFEIPLTTPQGVAIAPFEIEREGKAAKGGGEGHTWRARFSLDIEPMGPVHARVSLVGGAVRVSLWAEHGQTLQRLDGVEGELAAALRDDGLDPRIQMFPGAPNAPDPVPPGRFADKAV